MDKIDSKKYFVYMRISDDDYDKSLENQEDVLKKVAEDNGIQREKCTLINETKSWSRKSERPKFKNMIKTLKEDREKHKSNVENREYGGILFFKIDRLARNDKDFESLLAILDAGYKFISATETIENTPTGRLLFRMLASFAVFETEKHGSRQSIAKIHNLIKKNYKSLWGDLSIFWYEKLEKDESKKTKPVKQIKKQAMMVRRIYDLYIENWGKKQHTEIYEEVDKEFKWALTKYFIKYGKTTKSKHISNVLYNNNAFKYDGFFEYELNINDELIHNYLKAIFDEKNNSNMQDIKSQGILKMWGKIKFVFFDPAIAIITPEMREKVDEIIKKKKKKETREDNSVLSSILFLWIDGKEYKFLKPDVKKEKHYYHRKKVGEITYSIAEHKIIKSIKKRNE